MNLLFADESCDVTHSLVAKSNDNMKKSLLQLMINKIPISQDAANISRLTCQSYKA